MLIYFPIEVQMEGTESGANEKYQSQAKQRRHTDENE